MTRLIVDGHLDLAMNALDYERDQTLTVEQIRKREHPGTDDGRGRCTVTLDAMAKANVRLCVATLIARCKPWIDPHRTISRHDCDWPAPAMAHAIAHAHLAYYQWLDKHGHIRLVRNRAALADHLKHIEAGDDRPVGVILTMECADPITTVPELDQWRELGLTTLMLAHFGKSRYAHGTPGEDADHPHDVDGPLSAAGRQLLAAMDQHNMPLDLTHLSDASLGEAVRVFAGPIYSSHSGARAVKDHPRNHTDEQLRTIIDRGGVIGLPLLNLFLSPDYQRDTDPDTVPLEKVADHADHICQLAGSVRHVAIGSDLDGGFGAEHTPHGLETIADLPKLADIFANRGYKDSDIDQIMGRNWCDFWLANLPV